MKFITSTNLNQWAATKECQQLLPELIKRLIDASVSSVDKLSFPSGDVVYLPGWDGVVSCEECIDLVPAGISLWECGASENVKGKIDSDYDKRTENSLGYDKSNSTFVFVTPRIWEGAEDWLNNHQNEWKKVVVYTAVELERWIESRPSVGMWLAEKLRILPSGGYMLPETYWNRWAQGEKMTLPYEIILPGREEIGRRIVDTCKVTNSLTIQALTQSEGIAFAIASILTSEDADMLMSRLIVVTEKDAYNDLVEHYDNLILLTTVAEDIHYSTKRGHSVIIAATPADQIKQAVTLPIIEKEGFVEALVEMGYDVTKARKIAKDTARDINVFRRREGIAIEKPKWFESIEDLLPAILVGKWTDTVDGDKNVLELLYGMKYEQYEKMLYAHLMEEETPLIHVGNTWRIRSPYEATVYAQAMFTTSVLNKFREVCQSLIQDDDPEAIDKKNPDIFQFRQFKQKYSNIIKKGVYQTLCLMSIVDDSNDQKLALWVDEIVKNLLKDWDLSRFLSNKQYLTALAEASPKEFLNFIEKLPANILDVVFTPYKPKYSISGWEIEYAEILLALEMLAWDVDHLNRVTRLLLCYSKYQNESNFENKPINSLYKIYRFYLPQTYATFEERMTVLRACASSFPDEIYQLCVRICKSLLERTFFYNHYYRWRLFGELRTIKHASFVSDNELQEVVALMLQCCYYSAEKASELLSLTSNKVMNSCRSLIVDAVRDHLGALDDKESVIDTLRNEINKHRRYAKSAWALSEIELQPFVDLFMALESDDPVSKYAWLFEMQSVQLPEFKWETSHEEKWQKLFEVRKNAVQEIFDYHGINGIWNFVDKVKCPESLGRSLVSIFGDQIYDDICQKYKSKEINHGFVKSYLFELCRLNIPTYQELAKQTVENNAELGIVLFAPGYIKELAELAASFGTETKRTYWESVDVQYMRLEDAAEVVRELVDVCRFSDAISVLYDNRESIQMSDAEKVHVILGYTCGTKNIARMDPYCLATLLEDLDKSEDPEVIKELITVEFLLYRMVNNHMDMSNSRFVKELSRNPELMIQLVELAYRPDDGKVETLDSDANENKRLLAENALHILYFEHPIISFNNEDGVFDGESMKQYIEQLYRLAKERKRVKVIDSVVGDMLGDIPRDDNYPPQALCELVETLNSDIVDQHIVLRIYNSRGMTSRAYNEGGRQERSIVSRFEKYREKTKLRYPRMTKIFNDLIIKYKRMADNEDDEAIIADLEY